MSADLSALPVKLDRLGCLVNVELDEVAVANGAEVMMLAIVFSKLPFLKEDLRRAPVLDDDVLLLTDSLSVAAVPVAAAILDWLEGELVVDELELELVAPVAMTF